MILPGRREKMDFPHCPWSEMQMSALKAAMMAMIYGCCTSIHYSCGKQGKGFDMDREKLRIHGGDKLE